MSRTQNFDARNTWDEDVSYDGTTGGGGGNDSFRGETVKDKSVVKSTRAQKLAPGMLFRTGSDQLINCRICGRHFHKDRVEKHENVCRTTYHRKREPFNASKQLFEHLKKNASKLKEEHHGQRNSSPTAVLDLYDSQKTRSSTRTERKY